MQEEAKKKANKILGIIRKGTETKTDGITQMSMTVQFSAQKKAEQKGTQKLCRGPCKDDGDMPQGKVPSSSRSIPCALEEGCSFQGLGLQECLGPLPEAGGGLTSGRCAPLKVLSWPVKKLQDEMSILHSVSENEQDTNRLFAETLQRGESKSHIVQKKGQLGAMLEQMAEGPKLGKAGSSRLLATEQRAFLSTDMHLKIGIVPCSR